MIKKLKKSESASSATTFLRSQGFRVHVEEGVWGCSGAKAEICDREYWLRWYIFRSEGFSDF